MMEHGPPVVVRERTSRLTGSRVATALVFDRDFSTEELRSFFGLAAGDKPQPVDFEVEGRTVRYECEAEDAERWRLTLEIYLVKACRPATQPQPSGTGIRERAGFRKLHLG